MSKSAVRGADVPHFTLSVLDLFPVDHTTNKVADCLRERWRWAGSSPLARDVSPRLCRLPRSFQHLLFFISCAFMPPGRASKAETFEDALGLTEVVVWISLVWLSFSLTLSIQFRAIWVEFCTIGFLTFAHYYAFHANALKKDKAFEHESLSDSSEPSGYIALRNSFSL